MFKSKLAPWYMARYRHAFVQIITLPLTFSEAYFRTLADFLAPTSK